MKTAYLLIMLTFNAADQPGLSFVSTDTLEQCQLKGQALAGILLSSGIEVREHRCIQSELKFSKYRHGGTGDDRSRTTYRAVFSEDTVEIRRVPEGEVCRAEQENSYCATSLQTPVE